MPLRSITAFPRILKSSYEYWRTCLADGPRDWEAELRPLVRKNFMEKRGLRLPLRPRVTGHMRHTNLGGGSAA